MNGQGWMPVDLPGKRVLVTGGSGFIGSNLVRRLCSGGCRVVSVDCNAPDSGSNAFNLAGVGGNLGVRTEELAALCAQSGALEGFDWVFHLAAATSHVGSMEKPLDDLASNVRATLALLEAVRLQSPDAGFVFASTRQLYGAPARLPVDELQPIVPPDINAIHKLTAEEYFKFYSRHYRMRSAILRLTNTYGPGMRIRDAKQMFLGIWIRRLLEGLPFDVYGTGEQLRDLNYVADVVDAMLRATTVSFYGEVFNLGGGESVSLTQLADAVILAHGGGAYSKVSFPLARKSIDIGDYVGDFGKFTRATGWQPATKLQQGLQSTIDYYRTHWKHYT